MSFSIGLSGQFLTALRPTRTYQEDDKADEAELEKRGDINVLQRLRHQKLSNNGKTCQVSINGLLTTEFALRRIVQKEISLHQILDHQSTHFPQQELQDVCLKEELAILQRKFWFLEREWWNYRCAFHEGPLSRAFVLWRSHPHWYMHRALRDQCARQGGCCGRDCGCCANQNTSPEKLGAGHCTDECGCCLRARGFDYTPEEKKALEIGLEHRLEDHHDIHFQELVQVSIWGLLNDKDQNPFDLIETPRGAEQNEDSDESATLFDDSDLETFVPEMGDALSNALHARLFVCVTVACLALYQISHLSIANGAVPG
ncbi:hypothetical protein N7508_002555 [Penicillium antarcticum]|uniref:uncharacterized protein n=1 Tax=Penicillium antarcticum TaxID=416450 RepID=UPI0023846D90|nr:uncharacterized protein N7508_002555 [Penicillium antarcticum]KAJ5318047.1 hypothetical protein N7508_002555 [Penicillium antarcticum]